MEIEKPGDVIRVNGRDFNLNEIRELMKDDALRIKYNCPSYAGALSVHLNIPFFDASEVLLNLTQRDSKTRAENIGKIWKETSEIVHKTYKTMHEGR